MAVFRVERTRDYTVMSNHHFKNNTLSYRAVGLLSVMLSVPDNWDYTLAGLTALHAESIDAVRTALAELETAGYVERNRIRNTKGHLKETEYIIREHPILQIPTLENPILDNPTKEKPAQASPTLGSPTQLSTYESSIKKSNTNLLNTKGINPLSFWTQIRHRLSQQIPTIILKTWFDDCTPINFDGSAFTLQAYTTIQCDVIAQQYTATIESIMAELSGLEIKLIITSAKPDRSDKNIHEGVSP